ncbi:MAG: M48 family metallopeptidase [Culicoidibacterales bacterium]
MSGVLLLSELSRNKVAYQLKRRKSSRRIIIKVINGEVVVTAPFTASQQQIEAFITLQDDWIKRQQQQQQIPFTNIRLLKTLSLYGLVHGINFIETERKTIKISKTDIMIDIFLPENVTNDKIIKSIKKWLKEQAGLYFASRISRLKHNIGAHKIIEEQLNKVRVRYLKSAFGLCYAHKNEIVLNVELIFYEPKYVDYVILHELTHFIHQNHSQAYYEDFAILEPNWKKYRVELNALHRLHGGWSHS